MSIVKALTRNLRCIALAGVVCCLAGGVRGAAQTCSDTNIDATKISTELLAHPTIAGIRSAAAIVGAPMIPTLRQLAGKVDPDMTSATDMKEMAWIALARLGDAETLRELQEGLSRKRAIHDSFTSILYQANTPETLSILMNFILTDKCHTCEIYGDYDYDPSRFVGRVLAVMIPDPPFKHVTDAENPIKAVPVWAEWWTKHKDHPLPPPPHEGLSDPYLRCLAKMAEFGSTRAVLQLADAGGQQAVPALKQFSLFGTKEVPGEWGSLRGVAQAALAKLGDRAEFETILGELNTGMYWHAIRKLQYIGTREAVDAITAVLGKPSDPTQLERHRDSCLGHLVSMVKEPPLPDKDHYTDRDIETWKTWWAKNRDNAVIVPYKT